jgi:hypothetical protein
MRKLRCVLLGVVVGLLAVPTAQAQTDVNEIAKALKDSPVYIASGVEGTNQDTASQLASQLNGRDNLLLVMLPDNSDSNPADIARAIDKATGHKYIVGLSVGSEWLTAASTIMPDEVARDLMQRAVDTGTNPVERLGTFARNVHEWQADNPNEPASKKKDDDNGSFLLTGLLFLITGFCLVVVFLIRRQYPSAEQEVKLKASPGNVRDILRRIQDLAPKIDDQRMRNVVIEAITDTEAYFKRSTGSSSLGRDTDTFVNHLNSVEKVLARYVDVQGFPRYYDNPQALMDKGFEAVKAFNDFVLQSIKDGRKSDLTQFNVDTDILSAQRYR